MPWNCPHTSLFPPAVWTTRQHDDESSSIPLRLMRGEKKNRPNGQLLSGLFFKRNSKIVYAASIMPQVNTNLHYARRCKFVHRIRQNRKWIIFLSDWADSMWKEGRKESHGNRMKTGCGICCLHDKDESIDFCIHRVAFLIALFLPFN